MTNSIKKMILYFGLLFLSLAAFQNCSKSAYQLQVVDKGEIDTKIDPDGPNPVSCGREIILQIKEIETSISENNSKLFCERDSDCLAAPLGAKLCGGPTGFFVYSELNPHSNNLLQLSEQHQSASAAYNQECLQDMAGECSMMHAPLTRCLEHKCQ